MLNWECAYAQLKFARPHLKRAHPLLRCVYVDVYIGVKRAHAHLKTCVCSTGVCTCSNVICICSNEACTCSIKTCMCWCVQCVYIYIYIMWSVHMLNWICAPAQLEVYNDCAKYHFHKLLRSNGEIWWLEFFPWRRTKKILLNRLAGDSAGQMQIYSSKWVRHYHYNDCAKYHFHN